MVAGNPYIFCYIYTLARITNPRHLGFTIGDTGPYGPWIVSRIADQDASIFENPNPAPRPGPTADKISGSDEETFDEDKLREQQIKDLTKVLEKAKRGTPVFKKFKPADETQEGEMENERQTDAEGGNPDNAALLSSPPLTLYFYHPDHLGTSTFLTDAGGELYQFFLNLPFGETMAEQHSLTQDYATPYKFNGKELDSETGLYYYGARYYDPRASIWLSTDPLMEKYPNVNPYAYCLQNPVNYTDPTGMSVEDNDDWIKWKNNSGHVHVTYDSSITTIEEAEAKGYTSVEKVFSDAPGSTSDGENFYFYPDGTYTLDGILYDVDDTSYTTIGGATISENKSIGDAFGDFGPGALDKGGNALGAAAVVSAETGVGAPVAGALGTMAGAFKTLALATSMLNTAAELSDGHFNAMGQRGKGERNQTAKASGTDNPFKKLKPDPNNPNKVFGKDSNGKTKSYPKPQGFDEYWTSKRS